ncbi:hypothetical protein BDV12DRAFT_206857 [Aspergillus spectabilis]
MVLAEERMIVRPEAEIGSRGLAISVGAWCCLIVFSTLPAELLLQIASYLEDHTDTLHLAFCCHAFYPLLLPKVFTSLDLIEHRHGHLSHLTHTVASNPTLAREVRTLRVNNGWRPTSSVRYDPAIIQPLLESALGPEGELSVWEPALQDREDNDVYLALLLQLLPNLETLVLEPLSMYFTGRLISRIALGEKPFDSNPPLSNLRHFTGMWSTVEYGLRSTSFLPFFRLPSLRTFSGKSVCDGGDSDDEDYEPLISLDEPGYSNVTHINLQSSYSPLGFPDLIRASKRLESFIFNHSDTVCYGWDEYLDPPKIYESLCKHRESLEELEIGYDADLAGNNPPEESDFIGSFTHFRALKKLRVQIANVLYWGGDWPDEDDPENTLQNILPVSLESLILEDLAKSHIETLAKALEVLLSGEKYRCPNLVYLEIRGWWMHEDQSTEESNAIPRPIPAFLPEFATFKAHVELLCVDVGVEFCLRDSHIESIIEWNRANGLSE